METGPTVELMCWCDQQHHEGNASGGKPGRKWKKVCVVPCFESFAFADRTVPHTMEPKWVREGKAVRWRMLRPWCKCQKTLNGLRKIVCCLARPKRGIVFLHLRSIAGEVGESLPRARFFSTPLFLWFSHSLPRGLLFGGPFSLLTLPQSGHLHIEGMLPSGERQRNGALWLAKMLQFALTAAFNPFVLGSLWGQDLRHGSR